MSCDSIPSCHDGHVSGRLQASPRLSTCKLDYRCGQVRLLCPSFLQMEQCLLCTLTFLPQSVVSSFTPSAASFKSSLICSTWLGSISPESANVCQMETLEWLGRSFIQSVKLTWTASYAS